MKKILILVLIIIPSICFSQNKMWGNGGFNTNSFYWYLVNSTDSLVSQRSDSTVFYKPVRLPNTYFTGNVGIGTSSPTAKMTISGTSSTTNLTINSTDGANALFGTVYTIAGTKRAEYTINASSGEIRMGATGSGGFFPTIYSNGSEIIRINTSGSVGIGTTSPNSTTHVNGSFSTAYVAKTANYTLTSSDYTVEVTSGTNTQTLPTAVGITGRIYVITNSGSGVTTVGTTLSQTFVNVSGTPTTLTLNQFSTVTLQSNGANWLRITSL